jgi:hypothetical protein
MLCWLSWNHSIGPTHSFHCVLTRRWWPFLPFEEQPIRINYFYHTYKDDLESRSAPNSGRQCCCIRNTHLVSLNNTNNFFSCRGIAIFLIAALLAADPSAHTQFDSNRWQLWYDFSMSGRIIFPYCFVSQYIS